MKTITRFFGLTVGILLNVGFALGSEDSVAVEELSQNERPKQLKKVDLDLQLIAKIGRLYPVVQIERRQNQPFFSDIKEIARVRCADGKERLVIWVHVIVPAAMVDHGWGELLIFKDASDAAPAVRASSHSLSVMSSSEILLIKGRWLQFGKVSPLVSLLDDESLRYFSRHGTNRILGSLSTEAIRQALNVYVKDGRGAFLRRVPIPKHQEQRVGHLPERVSHFEVYPSLAEDLRPSGFKYSTAWEGTILIRVIPTDDSEKPVILEMGIKGWAEGIISDEVELLIWESRAEEPDDRPAPESQSNIGENK